MRFQHKKMLTISPANTDVYQEKAVYVKKLQESE